MAKNFGSEKEMAISKVTCVRLFKVCHSHLSTCYNAGQSKTFLQVPNVFMGKKYNLFTKSIFEVLAL